MAEQIRGVNLGGWLVLERWMTPSLFGGVAAQDEYTFMQELGPVQSKEVITSHRDTFITEEDFKWIKEHGFNAVRLPVGYWILGGYPPFLGGIEYVDQAFGWAEKHGLKVLLDFHAAPGSQNGWDHSGRIGSIEWHKQRENLDISLEVTRRLVERYGHSEALYGVEVMNEPGISIPMRVLIGYYTQAYGVIRAYCPDRVRVVFHDSFRPTTMALKLVRYRFSGAVLDTHLYRVFDPSKRTMGLREHQAEVGREWLSDLERLSRKMPVLVGEWSASLHPEALAALGEGDRLNAYRDFAASQLHAFASCDGWFYWSYKAEGETTWGLRNYPNLVS